MNTMIDSSLFAFEPCMHEVASRERETQSEARILIVDDNAVSQLVMLHQLRQLNCAAVTVASGVAAIEAIESEQFDLVLLDCHMPNLDGYATAQMIRTLETVHSRPRAPIVAITADRAGECIERCFSAGMDGHLAKPTSTLALRTILERFVD